MSESELTWGRLAHLRDEIAARIGPMPRAIWFVDQPAMTKALVVEAMLPLLESALPSLVFMGGWRGLPVYERKAGDPLTDEDRRAKRWFVAVPGVWVEMSDGGHVMVEV
jgi:hypothetical protein